MKHAVIVAHPSLESFNMAVAEAYAGAVRANGHDALVRDLYRMNFSPCLSADELPGVGSSGPRADALAERAMLRDVEVFAFVYPLWFNAPPAILKGYIDRVFGLGFGYEPGGTGTKPLLGGRRMISFSSSGAPLHWLVNTGAFEANRRLSDEHLSLMCGFNFLEHVHFGGILPGLRLDVVTQKLDIVRSTVVKHFGH
jgi:NAD(P)H dehydrogenase (quinone)